MKARFQSLKKLFSYVFLTFELRPLVRNEVETVGISSNDILARVAGGSAEQNDLRLGDCSVNANLRLTLRDSMTEACERNLAKNLEFREVRTCLSHYLLI